MTCVGFDENDHGDSLTASWDENSERDVDEHRRSRSTCLQVVVRTEEARFRCELFSLKGRSKKVGAAEGGKLR